LIAAIVLLGSSGVGVAGHALAASREPPFSKVGDAGSPQGVVAIDAGDASVPKAAFEHRLSILAAQRIHPELSRAATSRREEGLLRIVG
jgi:hypothetical protein